MKVNDAGAEAIKPVPWSVFGDGHEGRDAHGRVMKDRIAWQNTNTWVTSRGAPVLMRRGRAEGGDHDAGGWSGGPQCRAPVLVSM